MVLLRGGDIRTREWSVCVAQRTQELLRSDGQYDGVHCNQRVALCALPQDVVTRSAAGLSWNASIAATPSTVSAAPYMAPPIP